MLSLLGWQGSIIDVYTVGISYRRGQARVDALKAVCTGNKDDFRRRMGMVASAVRRGINPNEKVDGSSPTEVARTSVGRTPIKPVSKM
jgi:hypothetical protein